MKVLYGKNNYFNENFDRDNIFIGLNKNHITRQRFAEL